VRSFRPGLVDDDDRLSVIIRARDEAAEIGRCLDLLSAQRTGERGIEVIVVDSGSRDGTAEIARERGARLLSIAASEFSFGGALNLGAANARGELLVALSAHAFAPDEQWLARLAAAFEDPQVACASGDRYRPDGEPLTERIVQDAELARASPGWGYSNGGGAFRASLWRRRPFRADLPGCEDREWALYWLEHGYRCVVDPGLVVDHDHTHDSLPAIYRRARREAEGLALFADGLGDRRHGGLISEWWSDRRFYRSALRARLSHRRAARLLGEHAGRRRARERSARG
jgi:glycosyltransferase involved in cell wall biosynthesis